MSSRAWLALAIGVALFAGGTMAVRSRGIRNNNPGNLEHTGIPWHGLVGRDGRYAIFATPLDGIRAMMIDLHTGFVRDGEDTIRKIAEEWAPYSENPTAAYMANVAEWTGFGVDERLTWAAAVVPLAQAITRQENGENPYPVSLFYDAKRATGRA